MFWDRFTAEAQTAIYLAQTHTQSRGATRVTVEGLLIGLLQLEESDAQDLLEGARVDLKKLLAISDASMRLIDDGGEPTLDQGGVRVIHVLAAQNPDSGPIGSAHLLIALASALPLRLRWQAWRCGLDARKLEIVYQRLCNRSENAPPR